MAGAGAAAEGNVDMQCEAGGNKQKRNRKRVSPPRLLATTLCCVFRVSVGWFWLTSWFSGQYLHTYLQLSRVSGV